MLFRKIEKNLIEFSQSIMCDGKHEFTYQEILNKVLDHSQKLRTTLRKKSKCAILCDSELSAGILILSCISANMVSIPLSMNYGIEHCREIINTSNPDLIITDNINLSEQFDLPIYSLCNHCVYPVKSEPENILEDVAILMFTSGSTGKPKGAMLTEENLLANINDITNYFTIDKDDKILIARPLYHCAVLTGEFLTAIFKGANIHFFDDIYSPNGVLNCIRKDEITVLCATPTLFYHLSLLAIRRKENININIIGISGECLSIETARIIRSVFKETKIFNIYGLTEASPRVCYLPYEMFDHYSDSVGIPLKSIAIIIVDENGKEVRGEEHGELAAKGQNVMKGYYNNENLTKKVIIDDWLYTGDLAHIDKNGLLFIHGRKDDLIIRAGMNVYPKEIEDKMRQAEEILDALAYACITNTGVGIGLSIVLREGIALSIKGARELCSKLLPKHQLPDVVNIVDHINRNASGKAVRPRISRGE